MLDLHLEDIYFKGSYIAKDLADVDLRCLKDGKYLRSYLLLLTGRYFQLEEEKLLALGRIVEMVHNATLSHDDVIDQGQMRRGLPSLPAILDNKKSVLLGDYILAKALNELTVFADHRLVNELALTLRDLVEGEWIQMENKNPFTIQQELYEELAIKKTGSLLRWSFVAPALLKNLPAEERDLYYHLGEQLGVIFQITDDVIDFNGKNLKNKDLDLKNNNINYVFHKLGLQFPDLEASLMKKSRWEDLNSEELAAMKVSIDLSKEDIHLKLKECRSLLNKIFKGDQEAELFQELDKALDLIVNRVF